MLSTPWKSPFAVLLLLLAPGVSRADIEVRFDVDVASANRPISPLIYGTNSDVVAAADGVTFRRQGGNRLTGYNWENNASNAGSDWQHSSDSYLGNSAIPGKTVTDFHDKSLAQGAKSLITVQAAGYVAKDKGGTVTEAQAAPSARWAKVVFAKGSAFTAAPDANDGEVHMDEMVAFLAGKYGTGANARGIRHYSIDNEPGLWPSTHARLHPAIPTCVEVIQKNAQLAAAIKKVDPEGEIFGGVFYGYGDFATLQSAPDWAAIRAAAQKALKPYYWFVDHFLEEMKKASDAGGKRLLDVLDIHWYSEHTGDRRIIDAAAVSAADRAARVQAPRSLWDSTFVENSWIAKTQTVKPGNVPGPVILLPRLFSSIDKYYPGTRVAITEYDHGGGTHVSGGLATADFLGILGRMGVYAANYWPLEENPVYVGAAFRLFRNYDGKGGAFPGVSAKAAASDRANASIYAAFTAGGDALHLVVLNKHVSETVRGTFHLASPVGFTAGQAYGFGPSGATLSGKTAVTGISGNTFVYSLPASSAYHIVLKASGPLPTSIRFPGMRPLAGRIPGVRAPGFSLEGRGIDGRLQTRP